MRDSEPEGTGHRRRRPPEEGRRAPAEKPPPQRPKKGSHQHPTHPPAPKSGELFHRLRLLHLHNHLQTAIQVSCSQSFERFVIECAINPENEVRKKKAGGGGLGGVEVPFPSSTFRKAGEFPKVRVWRGWRVVCFLRATSKAAVATETPNPRQRWKRGGERVFKEHQ